MPNNKVSLWVHIAPSRFSFDETPVIFQYWPAEIVIYQNRERFIVIYERNRHLLVTASPLPDPMFFFTIKSHNNAVVLETVSHSGLHRGYISTRVTVRGAGGARATWTRLRGILAYVSAASELLLKLAMVPPIRTPRGAAAPQCTRVTPPIPCQSDLSIQY